MEISTCSDKQNRTEREREEKIESNKIIIGKRAKTTPFIQSLCLIKAQAAKDTCLPFDILICVGRGSAFI